MADIVTIKPVSTPMVCIPKGQYEAMQGVVDAAIIVDRDGLIYSDVEAELLRNALAELDGTK